MDRQTSQTQRAQQGLEPGSHEGYDESVLGVECAWPVAEREALLELS